MKAVRNWLWDFKRKHDPGAWLPGAQFLIDDFNSFLEVAPELFREQQFNFLDDWLDSDSHFEVNYTDLMVILEGWTRESFDSFRLNPPD